MSNLQSMTIVFENDEIAEIPAESIRNLFFDRVFHRVSWTDYNPSLRKSVWAESARIVLSKTANEEMVEQINAKTVFERILMYNDIAYVRLTDTDGKNRDIFLEWAGGEDENENQTSAELRNGDLLIVVSANSTAEDQKIYVEARPLKIYRE